MLLTLVKCSIYAHIYQILNHNENWNVSKGTDFSDIFCSFVAKTSDIKPLENWDVSNGINFCEMFQGLEISTINQNWNVSNG